MQVNRPDGKVGCVLPVTAVVADSPCLSAQAAELAAQLGLPLTCNPVDTRFSHLLVLTTRRLELREPFSSMGSVYVDFVSGPLAYRRRHGGGRRQPLARAVGLKGGLNPSVLDATAGLGRDAFVLACLGCRVHLVERSPVIGALLRHGLSQAAQDAEVGPMVAARMKLDVADSRRLMESLREQPDVVYLDPMYPPRTKAALVKKEMRVLRHLIGDDEDAPGLLDAALRCARRRVVVKRPQAAPSLSGPPVSMSISAENTRFDVYLIV